MSLYINGVKNNNFLAPMYIGNYPNNYTEFEADGTMEAIGNATTWRDELQSLIGQRLESPGSDIVQNNAEGTMSFKDSATLVDYITMNTQLNHDRKLLEDVDVHLHWFQASANIPNWMIQWRWQSNGDPKDTTWTSQKYTGHIFTYTSGTLCQITELGAVTPPEGDGVSDILQIRLIRDTNNDSTLFSGSDPLTGNAEAINMDTHIICDTLGSRTEYGK